MAFPADTTHVGGALRGVPLGAEHPDHHDALAANLNAVIDELGANPSGTAATVGERIANIEAAPGGTVTSAGITDSTAVGRAVLTAADAAAARTAIDAASASSVAALPGADARIFDVTSTAYAGGAKLDGTTDDTAAWQAAINACATAGGGVVTASKNGVSIIAGALQDTSGANAQITLPQVDYGDGEAITVVIRGLMRPAVVPSVIGATPIPDNCLVIKSTLAAGTGSVIGATGPAGTTANFTNIHVRIENLIVRTVTNPTVSGVDLRRVAACSVGGRVVVDTGSYDIDALAQPTTATSFGVRFPQNANGAETEVDRLDVVGFYNGVEHAEHLNARHIAAWGCRVGLVPTAADHASHIKRFMPVHCTTGIKPTGAHPLEVAQYNVEHANTSQGWRQTTNDIDDPSNYLSGNVRWWAVLAGTGPHNVFTVNGGSSLTKSRMGSAFATGSGGSADYTYRDRLTAGAGDNVLTLGATPVTNSPLVWVNGAIKWPVADYAISGSTITFGTAMTGGEVVSVQYRSTASSAAASTLSGGTVVYASDDFNRADSTALGFTPVGSKAWVEYAGPWDIVSNRIKCTAGSLSVLSCHVDTGQANGTVSAKIYPLAGSNRFYGLWVRTDGAGNGIFVQVNGEANTIDITRRTSGASTTIGTAVAYTPASGDTIAAVLSGTSIIAKVNGVTKTTADDATYQANTKHGLWTYDQAIVAFDDFSHTS